MFTKELNIFVELFYTYMYVDMCKGVLKLALHDREV